MDNRINLASAHIERCPRGVASLQPTEDHCHEVFRSCKLNIIEDRSGGTYATDHNVLVG
jgi:hypothetical protein